MSLRKGACCCGEVCARLPLAQSTVSQHLDLLKKAGLVEMNPDGTRSCYSLNRGAFAVMANLLADLAGDSEEPDRA